MNRRMNVSSDVVLLPLREKVARGAGRNEGVSVYLADWPIPEPRCFHPSSVSFTFTFSREGRREPCPPTTARGILAAMSPAIILR
jgi:hypothetical protein